MKLEEITKEVKENRAFAILSRDIIRNADRVTTCLSEAKVCLLAIDQCLEALKQLGIDVEELVEEHQKAMGIVITSLGEAK